jgi:exosortase E/protease (VPEID-CTERM system)
LVDAPRSYNAVRVRLVPLTRWAGLLALLFAELAVLALLFDPGLSSNRSNLLAVVVQRYPFGLRAAIAAVAATLFFGWTRLRDELRAMADLVRPAPRFWFFLWAHVLAFAGFATLTALILVGGQGLSSFSEAWVALWAVLGISTLGLWCLTALPPAQLLQLLDRCKWLFLGCAFIGLGAGFAGWLTDNELWKPLSRGTLWLVHTFLQLTGADTVYNPAEFLVGTSTFAVTIEPACSGYQGIGLVWVFLAAYLWTNRAGLRFPNAFLLIPIGTLLIWLANAVRIYLLILIGSQVSEEVAMGGFHSQAGWLGFIGIALGIMVATPRSPFFVAVPSISRSHPEDAYLIPFLTAVAVAMIGAAFFRELDYLYPVRVILVACLLWFFRRQYQGLRWSWSWLAFLAGAAVTILWIALEPSDSATRQQVALEQVPLVWATAWMAFRVAGFVVTVPFAEELAFRGYLMRRLISEEFDSVPLGRLTWLAFLGSSVVFGVLHSPRWLAGTVAGLVYALVLARRGYISDCVLAHATTNGLLACYALGTGTWSLMS